MEEPFIMIGRAATFFYFFYLTFILFFINKFEVAMVEHIYINYHHKPKFSLPSQKII